MRLVAVMRGDRHDRRPARIIAQPQRLGEVIIGVAGREIDRHIRIVLVDRDARREHILGEGRVAAQDRIVAQFDEGPRRCRPPIGIIDRQIGLQLGRRVPAQLVAGGEIAAPVQRLAIGQVARIALEIIIVDAGAEAQRVGQRPGKNRTDLLLVIGGDHAPHRRGQRLRRRLGHDIDEARRGRLSIQRRLRPAQHLDPLDIGKIGEGARLEGQRHIVQDHRDARLDAGAEGQGADAADRDIGARRIFRRPDAQRRRHAAQIVEILHRIGLQLGLAQHLHRQGHILHILFALLRRHDDVAGGHILRLRMGHARQRSRCDANQQARHHDCHFRLPLHQPLPILCSKAATGSHRPMRRFARLHPPQSPHCGTRLQISKRL